MPWETFKPRLMADWDQGQHLSVIAPTGAGKTTIVNELLPRRAGVVTFATKPSGRRDGAPPDSTLMKLTRLPKAERYTLAREWPVRGNPERVLLWPKFERPGADVPNQTRVFEHALNEIFAAGRWCVNFDEVRYLCETLGLAKLVDQFWQQGRSQKLSVVSCAQRPAWVPRSMYSQATHLFLGRTNDEQDLRSLGGIGFADSKTIRSTVARLDTHDVLYVNSRSGAMAVTRVNLQPMPHPNGATQR